MSDYIYRIGTDKDLGFIISSFVKSQRNSDANTFMPSHFYNEWQYARINRIINKSIVTIISDPTDSEHLFGYAIYQMIDNLLILHFIYIKQPYRNLGLARQLLNHINPAGGPALLTHIDQTVTKLFKNRDFPNKSKDEYIIKQTSAFIKKRIKYNLSYNPTLNQ